MTTEITIIPIANCDNHPRFIPSDRADTLITSDWLNKKSACSEGLRYFNQTFPDGCTYAELRSDLAFKNHKSWENWICSKIGGDTATAGYAGTATAGDYGTATAGDEGTATAGYAGTATAGDYGTATAGYAGTATAGDYGTATAGYAGTATAGDYGTATAGYAGTATAGNRGTATAGNRGTATAGDYGTATAGDEGIIRILEWCEKQLRYRVITGIIGENGIEANVPYIVKNGKLTKKQ
jgi:hypothetical protein